MKMAAHLEQCLDHNLGNRRSYIENFGTSRFNPGVMIVTRGLMDIFFMSTLECGSGLRISSVEPHQTQPGALETA